MYNKLDAAIEIYNQSLFLNTDYQEAFREEDYLKVTERYFGKLGCDRGFLCLCQKLENDENAQLPGAFTDNMILRKIFIKDRPSKDYHEVFPRGMLLPELVNSAVQGQSMIVFPIHFKNRIFGYLALAVRESEWPTSFVQAYMMALALAMENSAAQKEIADLEQFRNLYHRDSLTGLYNRRGYEYYLRSLYSRSKEENRHFTIVSIDMDGLKYINDNFGHAEGDAALSRLSVVLAELVQENEICARTGGDEFMVLLYYNKEGRVKMGKLDTNKKVKEDSLLNTAFSLFTTKGVSKTSISDIVNNAGVAKGTFYLYFKDKYDIRNKLVSHKSSQLFRNAIEALNASGKKLTFNERIIFIVDNIINQLNENKSLLTFIAKNLSWGVFKHALTSPIKDDDIDFRNIYDAMLADAPYDIVQPEVMIFMIVELVSSTCYSSILYNEPVDIGELKPYLYICINNIIDTHAGTVKA